MHDSPRAALASNWDDLRLFLEIARAGSFSKAAKQLHSTQPTVSRRIENLEQRLRVRLFDRLPGGVVLTVEGDILREAAVRIEDTIIDAQRCVLGSDKRIEGPVRLSLPDGLATFWLAPQLGRLQEAYPAVSVEFQCSMQPADVLNMESDLCILFHKPEAPDLVATRLGCLHFVPWASPDYLERFGTASTTEELLDHRLLDHEAYHNHEQEFGPWLKLVRTAKRHRYWTNSSASLLSAVQNGVGIAVLPTYLCEGFPNLAPLDLGPRIRLSFFLAYHPNVKGAARLRVVIDWIKSLFDQQTWLWFRDEYHPPKTPSPSGAVRNGSPGEAPAFRHDRQRDGA